MSHLYIRCSQRVREQFHILLIACTNCLGRPLLHVENSIWRTCLSKPVVSTFCSTNQGFRLLKDTTASKGTPCLKLAHLTMFLHAEQRHSSSHLA